MRLDLNFLYVAGDLLLKVLLIIVSQNLIIIYDFSGDYSEGATPDPIPNSEVKPFSANGTTWETLWESRASPGIKKSPLLTGFFIF